MMDVAKAIEVENKRHELELANIKRASNFADSVSFVSGGTIFYTPQTYDKNMEVLKRFRPVFGNYHLEIYYVTGELLCINYLFDEFRLALYCTDTVHALEVISGGKCRIEVQDTTISKVVCDVN